MTEININDIKKNKHILSPRKLLALLDTQGKSREQIKDELAHVWREKADNLIEVLGLEPDKDGYYNTSWGRKTREGLIETIKAVLNEE